MIKLFIVVAAVMFSGSLLAEDSQVTDVCLEPIKSALDSEKISKASTLVVNSGQKGDIIRIQFPEEDLLEINREDMFLGETEFDRLWKLVRLEIKQGRKPRVVVHQDYLGNTKVSLITTRHEISEVDGVQTETFTCVTDLLKFIDD